MLPPYPDFQLESSELLRALVDGTVMQVWEFWGEGEYPDSRSLKEEADRETDEVLATWTDVDIAQFAEVDRWARIGLADVGTDEAEDPVAHRRRRLAMRIVEVGLALAQAELTRRSLQDPHPTDRVYATVPGLWDALAERDFLLPLTVERAPRNPMSADPYLYFKDYAIFPNPHLRGTRELFWDLCTLVHTQDLAVQVAIDPFRVIRKDEVPPMLLEDYWFGLKVTGESLDSTDEHDLGRAVHWRNLETIEGQRYEAFRPLIATEFRWGLRDETIKTLQIEEIRPAIKDPVDGQLVLNRYLHSERDIDAHRFIHLDGALKGYPPRTYRPSREEDPLAKRGKAAVYRKLFRVDGSIPDDAWGMAVGQFFRTNELIAEHLGELVDERPDLYPPPSST